jgi:hypothetical protein
MAVNHRVADSDVDWTDAAGKDLKQADFKGGYLACPMHPGDPLAREDLRETPIVQPSAGRVVYVLPLTEVTNKASELDVGSQLDVFEETKPLLRKAPVLAVQCSDATAAQCSVLLDLTPSEGALLLQADFVKLYIVRVH